MNDRGMNCWHLRFTPKALDNPAQGRGASTRTLGTNQNRSFTLKGLHNWRTSLWNPLRVRTTSVDMTQGAQRAATLGWGVERLRRKNTESH